MAAVKHRRDDDLLLVVGPVAVFAIAGLLVTVRDPIGSANVALVLLAVVFAVGALGGRLAGAAAAAMAALSFNFFHTEPYRTLRIDATKDIVTVLLLFVIGVGAGWLADRRRAGEREADDRRLEVLRLAAAVERVTRAAAAEEAEKSATNVVQHELGLRSCRIVAHGDEAVTMPVIDWRGGLRDEQNVVRRGQFRLPDGGAAVPVTFATRSFGMMVLEPSEARPVDDFQRRFAAAVAEVLGATLAGLDAPPTAE
jgi:K+-sensing histidine kinase KdpD